MFSLKSNNSIFLSHQSTKLHDSNHTSDRSRFMHPLLGVSFVSAVALSLVMALALIASLSLVPATTNAQALLEEVLVTAQKRTESAQEVPISISVIDSERILDSGITDLGDLGPYVPNFSYNQTGISSTIKMRGISSGINPGFEQSVGTYVDGIYYGRGQLSRLPYYDLDRVEVLRGPQSVLFGKNTIAGALNIRTPRPTEDFSGYARFSFDENSGREEYSFAVGGRVADGFNARFSYLSRDVDGYYENTFLNQDESDDREQAARLSLFFGADEYSAFGENSSLYIKLEHVSFDSNGRFLEVVNPVGTMPYSGVLNRIVDGDTGNARTLTSLSGYNLETRQNYQRQANGDTSENTHSLIMAEYNHLFSNGGNLTAILGFNSFETEELCDCDFTAANLFTATSQEEYDQSSLEIRYASPGGAFADYVVGIYYQDYSQEFDDVISLPTNGLLPSVVLTGVVAGLDAGVVTATDGAELLTAAATAATTAGDAPLAAALTTRAATATAQATQLRGLSAAVTADRTALIGRLAGASTIRHFTQDSTVFSAFGQVTLNINPDMRVVLGGRFTAEDKDGTRIQSHVTNVTNGSFNAGATNTLLNAFNGVLGIEAYDTLSSSRDEEVFTPLLSWQWDFLPGELWYVSLTQGYKAGGFDIRSNKSIESLYTPSFGNAMTGANAAAIFGIGVVANTRVGLETTGANAGQDVSNGAGSFEYDEERADSFETGIKSVLAGGAAEFNFAIFHTSYKDLQISQFDGVLGFNVTNAGEATAQGIEIDTRWNITPNFTFTGSMAYLDFVYDEFDNAECPFSRIGEVCSLTGETGEFAPELTSFVSLDYTMTLAGNWNANFGIDVEYSSDYYVSPTLDENLRQESFARVDARFSLTPKIGRWEFLVTLKNLNNAVVNTFGNRLPLSTTLTGNQGTAYYSFFQPPRSLLLQYNYQF